MIPAFPKPGQIRKKKPAFKEYADGRIVFDLNTKAGRDSYRGQVRIMLTDQDGKCGLQISDPCKKRQGRLPFNEATFGHGIPRRMGGGSRDDRIDVPKIKNGEMVIGEDGNPVMVRIAMALCPWCNSMQGSRPLSHFLGEMVP